MNELKFLNDNYGHEAGDAALTELAKIFENSINHSTFEKCYKVYIPNGWVWPGAFIECIPLIQNLRLLEKR